MAESSGIQLIDRAEGFADRTAVVDSNGEHTYGDLLGWSGRLASDLLSQRGVARIGELNGARVAFLVPRDFHWAWVQWGIWRAGGVAVPLCDQHPPPELAYVIEDSGAAVVVAHPDLAAGLPDGVASSGRRCIFTADIGSGPDALLPTLDPVGPAMILYTSGSTGKTKGVVLTHASIEAQVVSLVEAWQWRAEDRVLNVLPMHHIHGIVNILTCALWSGACCECFTPFEADSVWRRFEAGGLTLFMAVPTVYSLLIEAWERASPETREAWSTACRQFRLMVSGSAALPVAVLEHWSGISGHTLLERYGMTEIGMALSNPLNGRRRAGYVGRPLPGVEVKLVDDRGEPVADGHPGEIMVRGKTVFAEYWERPEVTAAAFRDGWFLTGDVACREDGDYRILGRNSVDIIKTGGFKVSALEIEAVFREYPGVREIAVVGVRDDRWGEVVCAAIVWTEPEKAGVSVDDLRTWGGSRLARYKLPSRLLSLDALPRNTVGKVTKHAVVAMFAGPQPRVR